MDLYVGMCAWSSSKDARVRRTCLQKREAFDDGSISSPLTSPQKQPQDTGGALLMVMMMAMAMAMAMGMRIPP
jgi:hypothetical protein